MFDFWSATHLVSPSLSTNTTTFFVLGNDAKPSQVQKLLPKRLKRWCTLHGLYLTVDAKDLGGHVDGNCLWYGGNDFQFHSILLLYPSIFLDFSFTHIMVLDMMYSKCMHSGYSATKKNKTKDLCAQALKFWITFHKP